MRTVRPTEPDSEGADGVWHRHRAGHDVLGRSQVRTPRPGRQKLHVRTFRRSSTKLVVHFEAAHLKKYEISWNIVMYALRCWCLFV